MELNYATAMHSTMKLRHAAIRAAYLVGIMVLGCVAYLICYLPARNVILQHRAGKVIRAVDKFKGKTGQLPKTLNDVGYDSLDGNPYYYVPRDDGTFVIHYGERLGDSVIFDSKTRSWTSKG